MHIFFIIINFLFTESLIEIKTKENKYFSFHKENSFYEANHKNVFVSNNVVELILTEYSISYNEISLILSLPKLEILKIKLSEIKQDILRFISLLGSLQEISFIYSDLQFKMNKFSYFNNLSLYDINFIGCNLKPRFIKNIKNCKTITKINISQNTGLILDDYIILYTFNNMRILNLSNCCLESQFLKNINKLSNLVSLDISSNDSINLEECSDLFNLENLEVLSLSRCYLKEGSLSQITKLTKLKKLSLSFNPSLKEVDYDYVFKLENLEKLNLAGNKLKSTYLRNIENLKNLTTLSLSCNFLCTGLIKCILNLEKLESLRIDECGVENNALVNIRRLKELKRINIFDTCIFGSNALSVRNLLNNRNIEQIKTGYKNYFKGYLDRNQIQA